MLKSLEGKDGWLFLDNDTNNVIKQMQGEISASKIDWRPVRQKFKEISGLANIYGFKYLFLIAPNTHAFAKEFLPDGIKISDDRSAVYMKKNFPDIVLYPLELLRSQKDEYDLYYKTDTHWTELACIIVFNEISDKLGLETRIAVEGDMEEVVKFGDLGEKYFPPKSSLYKRLVREYEVELISTNNVHNTGGFWHFKSKVNNGKRAVIFGDSYTWMGLKTIAYYFEETFFFWQANIFDVNIIDQLRPNVVINETAERFFNGSFSSMEYNQSLFKKIFLLDEQKLSKVDLSDDYYNSEIRKMISSYIELTKYKNSPDFIFMGCESTNFKHPYLRGKITIVQKNLRYHFVRYNLSKKNTGYTIALKQVKCSVPEYEAGFYDFKHDRILHLERCKTTEDNYFHCMLGKNIEEIAFIVYAGLARETQGQWLVCDELLISECPWGGDK